MRREWPRSIFAARLAGIKAASRVVSPNSRILPRISRGKTLNSRWPSFGTISLRAGELRYLFEIKDEYYNDFVIKLVPTHLRQKSVLYYFIIPLVIR